MTDEPETLGLYVHVPFCEAKCTYCHFAIDPRRPGEDRQERYLRALLAEMAAAEPGSADTLYFGGGTPSLMAAPRLGSLIAEARRRFDLAADAEVTLEANPRDLGPAGYADLLSRGVNRLSLGVQSFDDSVLRDMGRFHTAADTRAAVRDARQEGFANVSIDLILGWPGETPERWERNLEVLAELTPEHVSLYVLEVEGKTVLTHRARRGALGLPADDLVADLYLRTAEAFAALGLDRYEISNFARPGFGSRHNARYWADAPFLGFGMSAHSYRGGRRWWNRETYAGYCAAVEGGGAAAVAGSRTLSPDERVGEALFTGLRRRRGIDLREFRDRYGVDPLERYGASLRDSIDAGLLASLDGRLFLTDRGTLVSSEVFAAFV